MQTLAPRLDAVTSPLWSYDKRSNRYRDTSTGRFLSQRNLQLLQQRHIAAVQADIGQIGELLLKGSISLGTWQEATAKSLKTLYLHQMVLARGGLQQTTASDYLATGRLLKDQYVYLRGLAIDLQRGYSINEKGDRVPMTVGRFRQRLALYSKSGRVAFEEGKKRNATEQGGGYMRRFLGIAEHCSDCLRYAALGIQPIGALPLPGVACKCRSNCRCSVVYYQTLEDQIEGFRLRLSPAPLSPGLRQPE
jgi:hypothetical protein